MSRLAFLPCRVLLRNLESLLKKYNSPFNLKLKLYERIYRPGYEVIGP